jgi:single-strand DNA-binding protein
MNKVILLGRVGQEPTTRTLTNGILMASVTLATTERGYTTSDGKNVPERTEWHNLVFWRKQAEIVQKYVHKGDKILVEGKVKYREYEKDNVKHRVTDIEVDNMEMLTPPRQQQVQTTAYSRPDAPTPPPSNDGGYTDIPF